MELSKELKEKAKACKTAEELVALAKANEIELSAEDAEFLLKDLAEKELTDNELENVSGGADGCVKPANPYEMKYWDNKEDVEFIFNIGDIVQSFGKFGSHHTATCRITDREATQQTGFGRKWYDWYHLEKVEGSRTPYRDGWAGREAIEQ